MEYDNIRVGYVERFRELIKEYAQLERLYSDDWSEDDPRIRLRKELNVMTLPVRDALAAVGLPFSLRLQERGRIFDVDLGSELLDLPSMPGFQGWGDLFDLLERAIGRYKERLDKTAVDEEVLRTALDLIGDDELLSRCTPLLTSVWTSSTEPPASELDEQVSGLDTVVREMSVILENRIRKLSGLSDTTLAGAALVSRAFGGPDAPLRFSTDAGIQESAHFLYRGYAGFVRNEAMHRLIRDYTKRRVLQLLALVDYLLFLLGKAVEADTHARS